MQSHTVTPHVAFLIDLGDAMHDEVDAARARHLVHLLGGHRLAATWSLGQPEQAQLVAERPDSTVAQDLALRISSDWSESAVSSQQFQQQLQRRLQALTQHRADPITVVMGDVLQLRARASLLAGQGVGAIVSCESGSPRPLACGLWQLPIQMEIPSGRRLWGMLPARHPSVSQLLGRGAEPTLMIIRAEHLGRRHARGLQMLDKLFREISWAASRQQLEVVTLGQIHARLAQQKRCKPQCSILRAA